MVALWGFLAAYTTWYFTSAKHYAPLTQKEAKILWKIHQQNIKCNAKKWYIIKRRSKIIGFKCDCGYKHVQKRPIVAHAPTLDVKSQNSQISTPDQIYASYKSR